MVTTNFATIKANQSISPYELYRVAAAARLEAMFFLFAAIRNSVGEILNFELIDINDIALKKLNIQRQDVIGKNFEDFYPFKSEINETFVRFKLAVKEELPYKLSFSINDNELLNGSYEKIVIPYHYGVAVNIRSLNYEKEAEKTKMLLSFEKERVSLLQDLIKETTHDIRTPLTIINSSLYLAKKVEGKKRIFFIEQALDQVLRMRELVDELSLGSKLEESYFDTKFEIVETNIFVLKIAEEFKVLMGEKSQELDIELSTNVSKILISEDKMYRAIANILKNAYTYTPSDGTGKITVRTSYQLDGDEVIIEIEDNGMGISNENLSKIFDKFFRVNYNDGNNENLGLGLSIAKKIVDIHGGNIFVTSEVNKGTKFTIKLPAIKSEFY